MKAVRCVALVIGLVVLGGFTLSCGSGDDDGRAAPDVQDAGTTDGNVGHQDARADDASPDVDAGPSTYQGCITMCEHMAAAGCTNPVVGCEQGCQNLVDYAPWCRSIVEDYIDCAAQTSQSNWKCDQSGNTVLAPDACQAQQDAALSCAVQGPPGGLPDLTSECEKSCSDASGLPCASQSCVEDCNDSIQHGFGEKGACRGAFAAAAKCASDSLESQDYACDSKGKLQVVNHACDWQAQVVVTCVGKYCGAHPDEPACQKSE